MPLYRKLVLIRRQHRLRLLLRLLELEVLLLLEVLLVVVLQELPWEYTCARFERASGRRRERDLAKPSEREKALSPFTRVLPPLLHPLATTEMCG